MELLFILAILLIGFSYILLRSKRKNNYKHRKLIKEKIPENLGMLPTAPIGGLIEKLDIALDEEYIESVKIRFLAEHPTISEDEFTWRLFELKRYFLLTAILQKAPMFSEQIDELWHEMLLFTKDYQTLSTNFQGEMLHHIPNINVESSPGERAFFDWVFSQLFEITEYTWKAWGGFFKYPYNKTMLEEFSSKNMEELKTKYFKVTEESVPAVEYLITKLKGQISQSEVMHSQNNKDAISKQQSFGDLTELSLVMVFYSTYYADNYWDHVKGYTIFDRTKKYASGCSAVYCGTGTASDGPNDSGGSINSCSSGSSCGGGCSS